MNALQECAEEMSSRSAISNDRVPATPLSKQSIPALAFVDMQSKCRYKLICSDHNLGTLSGQKLDLIDKFVMILKSTPYGSVWK